MSEQTQEPRNEVAGPGAETNGAHGLRLCRKLPLEGALRPWKTGALPKLQILGSFTLESRSL